MDSKPTAKIPFLFHIPVFGQAPNAFLGALRMTFTVLNTNILQPKLKGAFKKVRVNLRIGLANRVEYSPITGLIELDPSMSKIRDKRQGIRTNLVLALGMAFYDFSLTNSDRIYWKALTRKIKFNITDVKKKSSFGVAQVGKPRLIFASLLLAHFNGETSPLLKEFLQGAEELVELDPKRHTGLGLRKRELETPITVGLYGETMPLKDALDVVGITGITPELKRLGCNTRISYDPSIGSFNVLATKDGKAVLEMERHFSFNQIKNERFFIDPELQGNGLGLTVFATQVSQAIKHGINKIHAEADRNDDIGMAGYDIWWKFGFDGFIVPTRTKNPTEAKDWFSQAVVETLIGLSEMSIKRLFFDLMLTLEERVSKGAFSPSAYRYLQQSVLGGEYTNKKDFAEIDRKDFSSFIDAFNKIEPESNFLKEWDLSYSSQRIQRLVQLKGFTDWWTVNGGKWAGSVDLTDGEDSVVFALLKNYMQRRQ